MPNNLLRRPLLTQEGANDLEIVIDVMAIAPRPGTPRTGTPLSL
tara:strand:+ start:298 stop:429 length:132 start_codon:yes stop_codon:yes gene_type:complete